MSHRISLLLVDDDAASRRVLEREFERRGHAVAAAGSVGEAFALAARSPPDVVLWLTKPVDVETLVAAVERAAERRRLCAENAALRVEVASSGALSLDGTAVPPLADVERRHILAVYDHAGRNKRRTSELLGISLRTLYNKLTEYSVHGAGREPAPTAAPQSGEDKA